MMTHRTAQDLLQERRANALERHRETDPIAREMLRWHIVEIDAELDRRVNDEVGPTG